MQTDIPPDNNPVEVDGTTFISGNGDYALRRAEQLRAEDLAQCQRRTLERDQALARESAVSRELARALADNERLRDDLEQAIDLVADFVDGVEPNVTAANARTWLANGDPEPVDRGSDPDPRALLKAMRAVVMRAVARDLVPLAHELGVVLDTSPDAPVDDHRARILAHLGGSP